LETLFLAKQMPKVIRWQLIVLSFTSKVVTFWQKQVTGQITTEKKIILSLLFLVKKFSMVKRNV
jgi:hypothetical protein